MGQWCVICPLKAEGRVVPSGSEDVTETHIGIEKKRPSSITNVCHGENRGKGRATVFFQWAGATLSFFLTRKFYLFM